MLRKTFEVYSEGAPGQNLFIEIGRKHIACFTQIIQGNLLHSIEFFQFNEHSSNSFINLLHNIKQQSKLLDKEFVNTQIIWSNEECLCVPLKFVNNELAMKYMDLIFGNVHKYHSLSQNFNEYAVLSRVPVLLQQEITDVFSPTNYVHQYFMLLRAGTKDKSSNNNEVINIFFYPDYFVLQAYKNSQLQIIQTRDYISADDVLYYVMNVCKQYDLPLNETKVIASGMIDAKSNLYNILHQYLENFTIDAGKNIFDTATLNEYPLQFFLHFSQYEIV